MSEQEFIKKMGESARRVMSSTGVLASITIAQAILESGYGTTDLAVNANNFFGMKCSLSGNSWLSAWDGVSKYTKRTAEQRKDGSVYYVTADFRKYPDMETSVKDHSLYLLGAMNGSDPRYPGLKGETDYKKVAQIIKDGGYATDVSYVAKLCNIVERFDLTQYDGEKEESKTMNIVKMYATKSDCYRSGRTINVRGLMLHSVGCPQPRAEAFYNNWNQSGANACVHAVLQADGKVIQLLPWTMRGWHCASGPNGSGNNTHIGVEMTEPDCIKYTGGSTFTCSDRARAIAQVKGTYATAVTLFAQLCKQFGLDPLKDIISHREGHSKGIASNHGDPEHLWRGLGLSYTMDTFRADVKKAMSGSVTPEPTPQTNELYRVRKSWADSKSQIGAFSVLANAKDQANKNPGYNVYDASGKCVYAPGSTATNTPATFMVRVKIEDLNIRKGPGYKSYASVGYCPVGTYTIVETKTADGYTWGRLKSGAGWIALEYTERV